ncbi:Putative metabolite transport protein NicT [Ralstonia mannitolilytica]|uniref:MFS transporter n=1 Tax=Ralstonia mannitolilytica TaxID=105219 RepID=UPI0007B000B2|nr:MFS transporter [Ralstonia mannitolilytica]ATG19977.1 MFS transporter [Ralstonia pickettii]ANA31925.1 MFS transporter [Ralstonia mannitolilytica]CAJ0683244.1 Putative metabolite transport protein NicT [Ralstonia mannitolilytica]CAJ0740325.1 Putative metabolite transport protein NicT [Ralstonia mannitolilytica]CAJ0800543.1 Putative metabolite transport protein NicT [Ralstonia mannitolilytica]
MASIKPGIPVFASAADDMEASTFRKVSWRLLPFLGVLWVLAWLDRVNIGFAKLQMLDSLRFSEAVYGLGAGIFFLGYFLFEVPSNMLLQKIGAKKTIMRITICWGVICMLQTFVTSPTQFYILRFLLGAFEAGFYPGVILYLTYWYPSQRRARAFGTFMSASAIAGVLGGPLAGWIMTTMGGVHGLHGWQWLFILEGIPSVLAGVVTWFYMTDRPEQARWLTDDEKRVVLEALRQDGAAMGERGHDWRTPFTSRKVWLLIAIFFCLLCANSTLTFWIPTIIKDVGFGNPMAVGWIAAVAYLCGAIGMITNGAHSDRRNEVRWHFSGAAIAGGVAMALLAVLMGVPGLSPVITMLAMTAALVGTMSAIPVFWQLPNRYLTGSAAAVGVALINSVSNLAGFGAPYVMGLIKNATGKVTSGLYVVAAIEILAAVLVVVGIRQLGNTKEA